jgi:predicted phosphodiesterase
VRVLLLSDIHANLEALDACLAEAPEYDVVANLGDIVGYGASPNETVERSRELGKIFVRGNHDKTIAGLSDIKEFNPIAAVAALWTREQLSAENLDWLKSLPQGPLHLDGVSQAQIAHGSPLDEDEYLLTEREATAPLKANISPITFFGHTHLQGAFFSNDGVVDSYHPAYKSSGQSEQLKFLLQKDMHCLINPGSVGQPRDRDWRAAFGMFDSDTRTVTFCRVPYDVKSAQKRIVAANLPARLATRLAAGR